jgi:predicted SAM-dependent methyltransferase
MKKILNAGCGRMTEQGKYFNDYEIIYLDIRDNVGADIVHDLNKLPLPFPDNSFDEIWLFNIIEHLNDIFQFFEEVHRILKPGGVMKVSVPHYTDWTFWRDPSHKTHFNSYSFDRFQDTYGHHFDTKTPWKITHLSVTLQRLWRYTGIEWIINLSIKYPAIRFFRKTWEQYLCFMVHGVNIYVEMTPVKSNFV